MRQRPQVKSLEIHMAMDRHALEMLSDPAPYRQGIMRDMTHAMGRSAVDAGGVWYEETAIWLPGAPKQITLQLHVVDKDDLWWFDRTTRLGGSWYVRWARRAAYWIMRLADRWEGQL